MSLSLFRLLQVPTLGFLCQLPNSHNFPHKALNLSISSLFFPSFFFYTPRRLCAEKKACDLNSNNSRNKTDLSPSSLQSALPAWPVNMEPSIEALRLGGRDFFFFLPIFILTLWKTRRPSSSTAILSPWLFPFCRLDKDSPPRWSVLASPAHGYSRGFAHLCTLNSDHTPARPLTAASASAAAAGWWRTSAQIQLQSRSSGNGASWRRGSAQHRPHMCMEGDPCRKEEEEERKWCQPKSHASIHK